MDIVRESLKQLHQIVDTPTKQSAPAPRKRAHPEDDLPFLPNDLQNRTHQSPLIPLSRILSGNTVLKPLTEQSDHFSALNYRILNRLGFPYSAHLELGSISNRGEATFLADSPAWAQRGRFLQPQLLVLLRQEGAPEVTKVFVKVRRSTSPATEAAAAIKPLQPVPPGVTTHLATMGERIDGPLGKALKRLATTLQNRSQQ